MHRCVRAALQPISIHNMEAALAASVNFKLLCFVLILSLILLRCWVQKDQFWAASCNATQTQLLLVWVLLVGQQTFWHTLDLSELHLVSPFPQTPANCYYG